jgi:hypothetical protein
MFTSQLGSLANKSEIEAINTIASYLRSLQDELEYRLSVLDSSNISEIDATTTTIKTDKGTLISTINQAEESILGLEQESTSIDRRVKKLEDNSLHAAQHAADGSDPITPASIGAQNRLDWVTEDGIDEMFSGTYSGTEDESIGR